ncbi:MAG: hypothetical protein HOW73_07810 [Polyangiaceae bacterium]|nr:hypothetical protein [Polyangiaceae bacterium]
MPKLSSSLVLVALFQIGCGANVVFGEPDGEGGSGGDGGSPSTSTSPSNTSTATGFVQCSKHIDCPDDTVCQFSTGECIDACNDGLPCADGFFCSDCATSTCPECLDCIAGCVPGDPPLPPVQCDDHDDCGVSPGEAVCIFTFGLCAQRCGPASPPCPPGTFCESCATSSCPACDDCIGACVEGFK